MPNESFFLGLEQIQRHGHPFLRGARIGILGNRASVDRELQTVWQVIDQIHPGQIKALYTPQHGWWGDAQANMIETDHGWHRTLDVPLFSLYSETRRPTSEMLNDVDCLVVDLQDVGTRVYTYIWTVLECMRACAGSDVRMLVLDRPNPLGGCVVEGPLLEKDFLSFVGGASIPMRHGLTIGEMARWFRDEFYLDLELDVVPMAGWSPERFYDDLGRIWIPPSPNLPTTHSVRMYPGQVLLEGTNLSEGRGTTIPFEVVGAPFIDADSLATKLNEQLDRSVRVLPTVFQPTFDKWAGHSCGGVSFHVLDRLAFRSFATTVTTLQLIQQDYPNDFRWLDPPYEYETKKPPIDILYGSDHLRDRLSQADAAELARAVDSNKWFLNASGALLYEAEERTGSTGC